jgi:hypothetical protein
LNDDPPPESSERDNIKPALDKCLYPFKRYEESMNVLLTENGMIHIFNFAYLPFTTSNKLKSKIKYIKKTKRTPSHHDPKSIRPSLKHAENAATSRLKPSVLAANDGSQH